MCFISDNLFYIIPVIVFTVILFMSRHRLKEKRTINWIIIFLIFFVTICIYIYYGSDVNMLDNSTHRYHEDKQLYSYEDILVLSCAIGSLLWLTLKFICKSRGYPVSFFVNHNWDITNSVKILRHDDNRLVRILTGTIFIGLLISYLIFILLGLKYFISF